MLDQLGSDIATAILGVDTLWGGNVLNPSGTGRFIADSWFSEEPLPLAFTHPTAGRVRVTGGVGEEEDRVAIEEYLAVVDIPESVAGIRRGAAEVGGSRGAYLQGLAECLEMTWNLAMEMHGVGDPVSYEACVSTLTGEAPEPSDPGPKRTRVAELLRAAGHTIATSEDLLTAVDGWRNDRLVPRKSIRSLGDAFIAQFDALTVRNLLPYLPPELHDVPRANVKFLPIENAWFSGSMNYLGRARKPDGTPEYEATYELNAALEISVPEFQQLVSHEVVPGHVTTFAYLQNQYFRGLLGFEASVLTMNTRNAVLFEGIANNAILMAFGVHEPSELPDRDLEIGVLLAALQDDAKNQSSWLTWSVKLPQRDVADVLRREYLVSDERADKLSGAWGRHPLLGRMYLPAYRFGTEAVAKLRKEHPPEKIIPALFGCEGLVDIVTIGQVLGQPTDVKG